MPFRAKSRPGCQQTAHLSEWPNCKAVGASVSGEIEGASAGPEGNGAGVDPTVVALTLAGAVRNCPVHPLRTPLLSIFAAFLWLGLTSGDGASGARNAALETIHKHILSDRTLAIHAMVVVQRGRTIAEWYFKGEDNERGEPLGTVQFGADVLHDLRSVSKSVVSLLFGAAMADGAIKSLDTPVLDYFPEYTDLQTAERRRIRLRDLLSMTSGLRWNESGISYADPRNGETAMDAAADRYRYVLSRPIDAAPGTRWNYSSGDVALIAAVIARATKMPLEIFAFEKLFRPLGIEEWDWLKDQKGVPISASGLRLTPREMAKLGQLVLARGRWGGNQVLPAAWVDAATSPHVTTSGLPAGACELSYGYFFWLGPRCTPAFVAAMGLGGQRIYVSRAHDAVVVINAGLYNGPVLRPFAQEVDRQGIYRAVIAALPPS